VCVFITTKE